MNSVVVRRLRLLAVIAVVAHVLGSPAVASAGITPDQCDATPKYGCTHVNYEGDGYYRRLLLVLATHGALPLGTIWCSVGYEQLQPVMTRCVKAQAAGR